MPNTFWIIIAFVVALDLVVIPLVLRLAIGGLWKPIAQAHPPIEPAPDAVTRRYQSFKAGIVNLGFSFHVSVDESSLHLRPTGIGRLVGLTPASVPWSTITPRQRGRFAHTVVIAGKTIAGPKWCLELAGA